MSDIMHPIPFFQLMDWVLTEYARQGSVFGVAKLVRHKNGTALPIFTEKLEAPYGPAAGPHTQLAQNIVAAYAAGSRFFELKTVQIMDGEELSRCVPKPCITAGDECYNCEWSTELTVPQAYDEYIKGWVACKLLARELDLGDPDGFVFNMSVGYDLEGIRSEKIDRYIEGMKNAQETPIWEECIGWARANLGRFQKVDAEFLKSISPRVSTSITESTLHGCPPDEIERIATYLIMEKGLNTYVKCNPTLLGYAFARKRLDCLGFDYVTFDEHHFLEDLSWADAVPMFRRLTALCAQRELEFGVKLTNTFPVDVAAEELPSQEMFMSGRALFPLTIALARRITEEFDGELRISYSGGADAHNIRNLFDAGIWPITMATTVLKPGGYQRMSQIGGLLMDCGSQPFRGVDGKKVAALDEGVEKAGLYGKPIKPLPQRKMKRKVPLIDCFEAPCRDGCPIHQDIPGYLMPTSVGRYEDALTIILQRNALPFITGTICPHHCGDKCMRNYYEEAVHIREMKLKAAQGGIDAVLPKLKSKPPVPGKKVAVVGGGPAGLSAAFFLSREGVDVTVFERRSELGGIVRHVVPTFRISKEMVEQDVAICKSMGAKFELGVEIKSAQELIARGFTHVIFATGAWKPGFAGLEYGEERNVIHFLERARTNPGSLKLGTDVVVIGGGNTAMDAARAAKRIPGVAHVRLVYRRTRRYMPADEEELALALKDGVEFMELLAPVGVKGGLLTCKVMELGAPDTSGRRSPMDTGKTVQIPATAVITAVGEQVEEGPYVASGVELDQKGRPAADGETMGTNKPNVFVIGDSRRGPATVVEAMADAAAACQTIVELELDKLVEKNISPDPNKPFSKKGDLCVDCNKDPDKRCLGCPTVCEVCADVCPNRANVAVAVPGKRQRQIVHVDGMCNECGNCAVFCPYDSAPYKDKFTLFWSREDFENSSNEGFFPTEEGELVRLDGQVRTYRSADSGCGLPAEVRELIQAVQKDYPYLLK